MELNEEQKARAQAMADAVGADPVKYFGDALKEVTKKGNDRLTASFANAKLKLNEKYAQISQQTEQAEADMGVVREAYRIWYEKTGKDLIAEKKAELKTLFSDSVTKVETLWTILKKDAKEIADLFSAKNKDDGSAEN